MPTRKAFSPDKYLQVPSQALQRMLCTADALRPAVEEARPTGARISRVLLQVLLDVGHALQGVHKVLTGCREVLQALQAIWGSAGCGILGVNEQTERMR